MRRLEFSPEAVQGIAKLPPAAKRSLKQALESLRSDPQGRKGIDAKRLDTQRDPPLWRLAVGSWRVAYTFDGSRVRVLRVFPRSDGYEWVEE